MKLYVISFFFISLTVFGAEFKDEKSESSFQIKLPLYEADYHKLKENLAEDPSLINRQDKYGNTLLHLLAIKASLMTHGDIVEILEIISNTPKVDFSLKDNRGNTAVHIAAMGCDDRTTCESLFPILIAAADKNNFDFSILGEGGQSVLHLASKVSYTTMLGRTNNVLVVINNCKKPSINTLSSSGTSALYYAINALHYGEAHALLDNGADPSIGSNERKPKKAIKEYLKAYNKRLKTEKNMEMQKQINFHLHELGKLKIRCSSKKFWK